MRILPHATEKKSALARKALDNRLRPIYKGMRCIAFLCLGPTPKLMDAELVKGTLSLLILSLLSRKSMYGYEIAATVHRDTDGAFTWREGSLYPNLHKMEQGGLIVGEWEEKETGRKRRYYKITKEGRTALKEKLQSWNALSQAVTSVLEKSNGQA